MSSAPPKTTPAGPLREPLPAVYPIALIEVACRALDVLASLEQGSKTTPEDRDMIEEAERTAIRIIRNGLASHAFEAAEGRSRG